MGREPFPARPINSLLIIAAAPIASRYSKGAAGVRYSHLCVRWGTQLITSNNQVEDTKQQDFNNNQYFHPQGESPN